MNYRLNVFEEGASEDQVAFMHEVASIMCDFFENAPSRSFFEKVSEFNVMWFDFNGQSQYGAAYSPERIDISFYASSSYGLRNDKDKLRKTVCGFMAHEIGHAVDPDYEKNTKIAHGHFRTAKTNAERITFRNFHFDAYKEHILLTEVAARDLGFQFLPPGDDLKQHYADLNRINLETYDWKSFRETHEAVLDAHAADIQKANEAYKNTANVKLYMGSPNKNVEQAFAEIGVPNCVLYVSENIDANKRAFEQCDYFIFAHRNGEYSVFESSLVKWVGEYDEMTSMNSPRNAQKDFSNTEELKEYLTETIQLVNERKLDEAIRENNRDLVSLLLNNGIAPSREQKLKALEIDSKLNGKSDKKLISALQVGAEQNKKTSTKASISF